MSVPVECMCMYVWIYMCIAVGYFVWMMEAYMILYVFMIVGAYLCGVGLAYDKHAGVSVSKLRELRLEHQIHSDSYSFIVAPRCLNAWVLCHLCAHWQGGWCMAPRQVDSQAGVCTAGKWAGSRHWQCVWPCAPEGGSHCKDRSMCGILGETRQKGERKQKAPHRQTPALSVPSEGSVRQVQD